MGYYFSKRVNMSFEEAIHRASEELKREGFGIFSDIDMTQTLKKRMDVEFRPYRILGACYPPFAHKALLVEPHIGLMLPCNVVIQVMENQEVEVSIVDPVASMIAVTEANPDLTEIAAMIGNKLQKVLQVL